MLYGLGGLIAVAILFSCLLVFANENYKLQVVPADFYQQWRALRIGMTREEVHRTITSFDRIAYKGSDCERFSVYGYESWLIPYRCRFDIRVYYDEHGRVVGLDDSYV